MRLRASVIAIALLSPLAAFAQTPPPAAPDGTDPAAPAAAPPPAAPAPAAEPAPAPAPAAAPAAAPAPGWKDLVTLEGLVDTFYMWNFMNGGANNGNAIGSRAFDLNTNTFTLNYAKIGVGVNTDNVGLRIDLGYGATGVVINSASPGLVLVNAPITPPQGLGALVVQQAFATVSPVGGLTIDAGKFVTTAGAEVIEANKNWMYSRSILFNFIPLLHTGVRVGYKINDMVAVQGSVVNNWNGLGVENDLNTNKTFGVNASITLPQGIALIPTLYVGKEPGSTDTRILVDFVGTFSTGPLSLNLNIDYINDAALGLDNFFGAAGMGRFVLPNNLSVNGRVEFFTGTLAAVDTTGEEVTVNVGIPMAGRFEFRPEVRADFSNQPLFPSGKKNQVTATGAFLAWF